VTPSSESGSDSSAAADAGLLQSLVDHARMLVMKLDLEGRIIWCNNVFEDLAGCSLNAMYGREWVEAFVPAEAQEATRQLCRGMVGQERGDVHTKPFLSAQLGIREIEWSHSDLLDDAGKPTGIICIGRDVTELQSARQALVNAEQRNRAVLETAVNAIITMNDERIIETVNSATERLFGYTREEMVGQNVKMLMPEPYAGLHDRYVENYKQSGKRKIIGIGREVVAQRKDGTIFPIDLSVGEVRLADGKRLFTGIVRDLTERKLLEDKILRISEEEQHRIGQDIHDDLCQQLAAIGCLAKVVQLRLKKSDSSAAADVDEIVQLLTSANQRAREMARGMVPVVLDSAGLMAALEDMARATQQIFKIDIVFHCHPPVEVSDNQLATQLFRIAQEGISNAVKHSHATQVELTLAEDHSGLRLVIQDNGNGLPEGRSGVVTGMGLLTMSRRARMVGGELSVANHPLGGTLVTCSIPIPLPSQMPQAETA